MSFVPHGGTTPPEWIERDTLLHTSTVKSCKDREQPVEPRHAIVHSQSVPEKLRLCPPKCTPTYLPTYSAFESSPNPRNVRLGSVQSPRPANDEPWAN